MSPNPLFSERLKFFVARTGLSVSRIAQQAELPKQTLFNWCEGRTPRWHPGLPADITRLSRALGLSTKESDQLMQAAGCVCAVATPEFESDATTSLVLPTGWLRAGSHPSQYDMGRDPEVLYDSKPVATIRSRVPEADGFGTLMQTCRPGEYRSKRVRFSAWTRTEDVADWAGLWLRVDGEERQLLGFDNMQNRPLKGTSDWSECAVVLDVADHAAALAFGILLAGLGRVWIAEARFESVGLDVPSTNLETLTTLAERPQNLDFRE